MPVRSRGAGLLLIEAGAHLLDDLAQGIRLAFDRFDIVPAHHVFHLADGFLGLGLHISRNFITKIAHCLFCCVDRIIGMVAHLDEVLAAQVFFGMRLGFLAHPLDFRVIQAG